MVRWLGPLLLIVTTTACGARSQLRDPGAECEEVAIGLLGNPGAYDTSADFEGWLTSGGARVERLLTTPGETLTAETLEPFDVVVLDWLTRDYTAEEAATFADWVERGGGVMSMTGWNNTADDWRANSLLAPLQVAYSGPLIEGPVTDIDPHPVTDGITWLVFKGGYAVSDLGGDASTRTPIAFLPGEGGNVPVGYAVEMGNGRAFVWGDEWIVFLSQGPSFSPRLWVQTFAWLAPAQKCRLRTT